MPNVVLCKVAKLKEQNNPSTRSPPANNGQTHHHNNQGPPMSQRLCQIAFSVSDLRRSHQWYQDLFGFTPGGGTESFKGWATSTVQGVPGARTTCWWLLDTQEQFQVELFEYERPESRPLPADWRMCDIGYNLVGIHVPNFDAALQRAARLGADLVGDIVGQPGKRRACLRDPDGALLELMEDDPRSHNPRQRPRGDQRSTVRFITLSVANLEQSCEFFRNALELDEAKGVQLHGPEHEALWGLAGAQRKSALFWADDMLVEIVQYASPLGRAQPADYRISDLGILNIAFGYRQESEMRRMFKRTVNAGAKPNFPMPISVFNWAVMYVNDPQGFSIELLSVRPYYDGQMGFTPKHFDTLVHHQVQVDASREVIWDVLADHANIGDWWCYQGKVLKEGQGHPGGVGALRELSRLGEKVVEEVMTFEPLQRMDYRLISGAPVKFHFGRIDLKETADGRVFVDYSIRFKAKIPGTQWLMRLIIGGRMKQATERLKTLCEQRSRQASQPPASRAA